MNVSETPGALKRFRNTAWKFQQTFQTPLKDLERFVTTIVSASQPLRGGCVTIDTGVFDPTHLIALLSACSLPTEVGRDTSVTAENQKEVEELLEAVLSDWIDFSFIPRPKSFGIYAAHDEYATFYGQTRFNLNRVVKALSEQGFKAVPNYERPLDLRHPR